MTVVRASGQIRANAIRQQVLFLSRQFSIARTIVARYQHDDFMVSLVTRCTVFQSDLSMAACMSCTESFDSFAMAAEDMNANCASTIMHGLLENRHMDAQDNYPKPQRMTLPCNPNACGPSLEITSGSTSGVSRKDTSSVDQGVISNGRRERTLRTILVGSSMSEGSTLPMREVED